MAAGVALLLLFALPVTQIALDHPDDGNQFQSRAAQRITWTR